MELVWNSPASIGALAEQYITEKVVGPTSLADFRHIAMTTFRGYNFLNLKVGFHILEIGSPKELMEHENEGSN